jgi:catechol 2,3-dioxygenase-like lactoylglutathione lyase family enzyme
MTPAKAQDSEGIVFGGVQPILRIDNLATSLDYYVRVLGFKVDFQEIIASVSRGRCALLLVQGDQGHPGAWVWVGVSDVESLYVEYRRKGARIRQAPTNFLWALEMQVEDPDGNVLRFGCEPKAEEPFGPWLDMRGRLVGVEDRWPLDTVRAHGGLTWRAPLTSSLKTR